jgi:two-component system OmpR family sensor kinase
MPEDLASPAANSRDFFRELDIQLLVHELKSPLSLIEATTRTLVEHPSRLGPLTERQERALKRILRGAVRGRSLVDQLLEIGRAESSQFAYSSFDPAEAVLHILLEAVESIDGELAGRLSEKSGDDEKLTELAQAGINLEIAAGVKDLTLFQDPVKFDLVVGNVIQNALRFRRQLVEVALHEEGDNLIVVVKDDGPGIPPEHHAAIFERYKQVAPDDGLERKGHGLGLAGALILARRLGGDISLDSVPGQGATFRISIPRGQARAQANASELRGA